MILTNSVDGSACKGFGEGLGRRLKGIGACGLRSREMRSVALRIVTDGGRLRAGLAAFEVERTADYVVLWMPVGSPGFSRQGRAVARVDPSCVPTVGSLAGIGVSGAISMS